MSERIRNISISEFLEQLPDKEGNVMTRELLLMMDTDVVRPIVSLGQPYQLAEGRFVRVVNGRARVMANLRVFELTPRSVFILPPDAIIQYDDYCDDFQIQAFSYATLPAAIAFDRVTLLHLGDSDFRRTGDYLQLMLQVLHKDSYSMRTIQLLQMALMNDLHHIQTVEASSARWA